MFYELLLIATSLAVCFGLYVRKNLLWKPVSENEVIYAWLKAEATDPNLEYASYYNKAIAEQGGIKLDDPSFTDEKENADRKAVFNKVRGNFSLWKPIHETTTWYKTTIITINPFMRIFGPYPLEKHIRPKTSGKDDKDENEKVDKDENEKDDSHIKNFEYKSLNNMVLWGHSKSGPFVILHGNRRWYSRNTYIPYIVSVYVGLSDQKYELHKESGCEKCQEN